MINQLSVFFQAPIDGITGDVCRAGGYCPVGSAIPVPCPVGTFSNTTGLRSSKECLLCPPGYDKISSHLSNLAEFHSTSPGFGAVAVCINVAEYLIICFE